MNEAEIDRSASPGSAWLRPETESAGLQRYLATLRERAWVVALAVLVATGAAALYLLTADKVYEAEADVLVTPIPREDTLLAGMGLVTDSTDPLRGIETVARLITAENVADRVERDLGSEGDVTADPVAESNIVSVTAEAPSPELAADLANAYAEKAIAVRTAQFQKELRTAIGTLQAQLSRLTGDDAASAATADDIARLQSLRGRDDPTLRLETPASPPTDAVRPKPKLSLAAGVVGGLALGITAVFAWALLDPRIRREEDLRRLVTLPVLTRVPFQGRGPRGPAGAISPDRLSPAGKEAYRALRFALAAAHEGRDAGAAILVNSAGPSEGKTTTSVNLAAALAAAGRSVVLIEADLRRPAIARALRIAPPAEAVGVADVLLGRARIEDAVIRPEGFDGNLSVLLATESGEWMGDLVSGGAARRLVDHARRFGEFVIIDSPPATEVTDALPLAAAADDVVIVVRLGASRADKLTHLGELLEGQRIRPIGIVLVGGASRRSSYYSDS